MLFTVQLRIVDTLIFGNGRQIDFESFSHGHIIFIRTTSHWLFAADLHSWKLVLYGTEVDPLNPGSDVPPPRPAHTSQPIDTTGPTPYNTTTQDPAKPIAPPFVPQGNLSKSFTHHKET